MQSSHSFTNIIGDIPVAEMFEAQVKRLKSIFSLHTQIEEIRLFIFCLCVLKRPYSCVYLDFI